MQTLCVRHLYRSPGCALFLQASAGRKGKTEHEDTEFPEGVGNMLRRMVPDPEVPEEGKAGS